MYLENQLKNLQQNIQNQFAPQNQTQQPYYLYCGNKNDWDEFLMLNYGITERNIFDDYKLFFSKHIVDNLFIFFTYKISAKKLLLYVL